MNFKSIRDMNLSDKTVLLRADLNVPAQKSRVNDTARIDRLKPTIDYLRKAQAKIVILSHFGRPEGEQNPEMSLAFLIPTLEKCWNTTIRFAPDCIGAQAETVAQSLGNGDIALFENLRFHKGEKTNNPDFVAELAKLGDIYVNDAFSAAHRAHASTEGLAHLLPTAAGFLMEEELTSLDRALEHPQKPVMAIAGGSKISSKLNVLKNLVEKVDYLVLGGGMANTFLYAQGANIGSSLCEQNMADEARNISAHAKEHNCEILLPHDCICVTEIRAKASKNICCTQAIPEGEMAIDIGPKSLEKILGKLALCKTVLWNGPLGIFEIKPFDKGTNTLAKAVAKRTQDGECTSVAGGGDTVSALENAGVASEFTYISSAGGAFLEWLEGKTLPGVAALNAYKKAA